MVVDDQANALPQQPFSDIPLKLVNLFDRRYVHVFKIDELKIDFVVHRFAIYAAVSVGFIWVSASAK